MKFLFVKMSVDDDGDVLGDVEVFQREMEITGTRTALFNYKKNKIKADN